MKDGELYRHDGHAIHSKTGSNLRFHQKAPGAYTCSGCKMPGWDQCVKCIYENCDFHLHKTCFLAKNLPTQYLPFLDCEFEFDAGHVTDNFKKAPYCQACGLEILGFRYRCTGHSENPHQLHPTCAHLTHIDKRQNNYGLIFELQDKVKSVCLNCRKRYLVKECKSFTGWKWVCRKREWSSSFSFRGRTICYHLKCMNEIQSSSVGGRVLAEPKLAYLSGA